MAIENQNIFSRTCTKNLKFQVELVSLFTVNDEEVMDSDSFGIVIF